MMKVKFFSLLFLTVLVVVHQAAAQGSGGLNEQKPAGEEDKSLTLVDGAGRRVTFSSLPERIAVIGYGPFMPLHMLYMFPEGVEKTVGFEANQYPEKEFISLIDPDYDEKRKLSRRPGLEEIASLEPDLVVMKGSRSHPTSDSLAILDIPVFYLSLETPELFFTDLEKIGKILGNEERAEDITNYYREWMEKIQKRTDGIKESEKPSVLIFLYKSRSGQTAIHVPPKSWMQTIQTELAGGKPAWLEAGLMGDGWTVVNFEQAASWNPDKIIVIPWQIPYPEKAVAALKSDPRWRMLKAVQNDEFYVFPKDIFSWDTPGPRWALGLIWMARTLYPERFKDVEMEQEIRKFFKRIFNMEEQKIETGIMPAVKMFTGGENG